MLVRRLSLRPDEEDIAKSGNRPPKVERFPVKGENNSGDSNHNSQRLVGGGDTAEMMRAIYDRANPCCGSERTSLFYLEAAAEKRTGT
jgi:hypothetical protein